jgi:hypothetical protein
MRDRRCGGGSCRPAGRCSSRCAGPRPTAGRPARASSWAWLGLYPLWPAKSATGPGDPEDNDLAEVRCEAIRPTTYPLESVRQTVVRRDDAERCRSFKIASPKLRRPEPSRFVSDGDEGTDGACLPDAPEAVPRRSSMQLTAFLASEGRIDPSRAFSGSEPSETRKPRVRGHIGGFPVRVRPGCLPATHPTQLRGWWAGPRRGPGSARPTPGSRRWARRRGSPVPTPTFRCRSGRPGRTHLSHRAVRTTGGELRPG